MNSKLNWLLAGLTAFLGASGAFADGLMSDADTVRAEGGVGNFLFYDQYRNQDKVTARDTAAVDENSMIQEDEGMTDAYYDGYDTYDYGAYDDSDDSLNLGASSAGRAR